MASVATGYMSMQAATSGTLSTIDERMPMRPLIRYTLWNVSLSHAASSRSMPACPRAPTDIRMPRKKSIVDMSMLRTTCEILPSILSSRL